MDICNKKSTLDLERISTTTSERLLPLSDNDGQSVWETARLSVPNLHMYRRKGGEEMAQNVHFLPTIMQYNYTVFDKDCLFKSVEKLKYRTS